MLPDWILTKKRDRKTTPNVDYTRYIEIDTITEQNREVSTHKPRSNLVAVVQSMYDRKCDLSWQSVKII